MRTTKSNFLVYSVIDKRIARILVGHPKYLTRQIKAREVAVGARLSLILVIFKAWKRLSFPKILKKLTYNIKKKIKKKQWLLKYSNLK